MPKTFVCMLVMAFSSVITAQELSKEALLDFANTRYQAYFHYNMCTFKNLDSEKYLGRAHGDDPVSRWNPTGLDCEQWARVCIDAKMAGGWLTTKHHGGFCLWDSRYTDYDVASSPVKTDVVRAFTDAFRKAGLKVGFYYSILDYHHGVENGAVTAEEIEFLQNQVTELLTNYGPIDYINFDGWSTWPTTPDFDDIPYAKLYRTIKAIQPNCLIVNHTYESNLAHADVPFADAAGRLYPYHPDYRCPAAGSDFLERGWWWNNKQYRIGKSVEYVCSRLKSYNAHNGVYILNLSPSAAGRIEDAAIKRLNEIAAAWDKPVDLKAPGDNWGFQYNVSANLAFMRTATQSSTHPFIRDKRAYPRAEIAIDGVLEGNSVMEQTSMTNEEEDPWWQVDLERVCTIDTITIYNRTGTAQEKLKNYWVTVMDDQGKTVWKSFQESCPGRSITLTIGGKAGRTVRIQLEGMTSLYLAEVVVTGKEEALLPTNRGAQSNDRLTLWYDQPGEKWSESLPIGNGRMGAMMHGHPAQDLFYLNEETIWSGGPHDHTNMGSHQYLELLRQLIREEKYDEAAQFGADHMLGVPRYQQGYQSLGKLHLSFPGHEVYAGYHRQLDMSRAVVEISYQVDDATYTRQILASHPDQVIAIQLNCDKPGKITFEAYLSTEHDQQSSEHVGSQGVAIEGGSSSKYGIEGGICFRSQLHVTAEGGSVALKDNKIHVTNADAATLLLVAATNYVNYQDVSANPEERCAAYLSKAQAHSFADIKKRHVADHGALFDRVSLDLGGTDADTHIPTDQLLQDMIAGAHSALLEEQLFQFARYLTIAGARPGTQPMNLVGIWAEELGAPWGGKWTLNINAELNTWPAETTNLAECHEPLLALLEDLRITGRKVAREHYQCRGFVAHHNTDLWRGAAPVDTAIHGLWPMGGAWLSRHIWEHYDFSRDIDYLRHYYPTMKEAAEFFVDYLTLDRDGYLSTCPAISFEQTFIKPDGTQGRLTYGPTMDNQILRDLFTNCIAASELLDGDAEFREQIKGIRAKLRPTQIDPDTGCIMEWAFKAEQSRVSGQTAPLWGLSPGRQITLQDTPELAAAAIKHLGYTTPRMPGYQNGGSWVTGTILNEWARLGQSEQAYKTIHRAITQRLYPNLMMHFYTQKYFEIDGNMGTCAGITEMLLQSHRLSQDKNPIIDLLPALPKAWPTGSVRGLRARGAFEIDIEWKDTSLQKTTIRSLRGTPLTICYKGKTVQINTESNETYRFGQQLSQL